MGAFGKIVNMQESGFSSHVLLVICSFSHLLQEQLYKFIMTILSTKKSGLKTASVAVECLASHISKSLFVMDKGLNFT